MTPETLIRSTHDQQTERVDPVECLDDTMRNRARPVQPVEPGRYLEVQGRDQTLLIPLSDEVLHIGRGLASDLRLDESSVSRRHAILVPRSSGARLLDDRSSYGTFVNGRPVQQADLLDGDVIVLGRVMLRYLEV
ncbi:MAG TPA: FHA domain-containing protein [Solirubrobacteraceae bacterium]|jgi:pSer/pThr/pTyr-binding forkhead associated (FHA) protein|nr:FHA domain-containing protein [Solirubrobacteraceae bacterium]